MAFVDLSSAYAQQLSDNGKKGNWVIFNEKKEKDPRITI